MNNSELIAFKAISDLVKELNNVFTTKAYHGLKLYEHLLSKTTLSHEKSIKKHISIFRDFCVTNREILPQKNNLLLVQQTVEYSSKAYIDFKKIFDNSDNDTKKVIWKHLMIISATVDPEGEAKKILKNDKNHKEADFLSNIISKVEKNVKPNSNPMEAVSSIMSSGIFNELITDMNSGIENNELDLSKLMSSVQQICSSLNSNLNESSKEKGGENPMNNMLNGLMSGMKGDNSDNNSDNPMNMLNGLLSGMKGDNSDNSGDNPMNMLSGLLAGMSNENSSNGDNPMNMLSSLMSGMNSKGDGSPDITSLLGPMLASLGDISKKNDKFPTIEEISNLSGSELGNKISSVKM
jgi:hypothetical protein